MAPKAYELREKSKDELMSSLKDMKQELASLRVAKVTGGAQNKLAKIRSIRKGIARTLTVINQKTRAALKEAYTGKKYQPLDLRQKKTRAIRRRLTKNQREITTLREAKKAANFPQRKFAIKA